MPATELVILLSLGSFQAFIPGVTKQASTPFEDSAQGVKAFASWAQATLPTPKFNQPPLSICVVGAVAFTKEKAPYLPKPLWESQHPLHALEPYAATFHYVPVRASAPATKARTMQEAVSLCTKAASK